MTQSQALAEIIRMHRKAAKLSRAQLAEIAGVGKTVIYDIEKGKESVRLNTLQKILNFFQLSIEITSPLMESLRKTQDEKS